MGLKDQRLGERHAAPSLLSKHSLARSKMEKSLAASRPRRCSNHGRDLWTSWRTSWRGLVLGGEGQGGGSASSPQPPSIPALHIQVFGKSAASYASISSVTAVLQQQGSHTSPTTLLFISLYPSLARLSDWDMGRWLAGRSRPFSPVRQGHFTAGSRSTSSLFLYFLSVS